MSVDDPLDWTAHEQYDDLTGTVALDDSDFDQYSTILGLPEGYLVIGVAVDSTHVGGVAGDGNSTSSYTNFEAIALRTDDLPDDGGLPAMLADRAGPIPVTRFAFSGAAAANTGDDAMSILLRGAKRVSIRAWSRTLHQAKADSSALRVVAEFWREASGAAEWQAADE